MIRTSHDYRDAMRSDRKIYMGGERVNDIVSHPAFAPLVDLRAHIYDMQHDPAHRDIRTNTANGNSTTIVTALPYSQFDWWAKQRAADRILSNIGGIATRIDDETAGEFWSLYDLCRSRLYQTQHCAPGG